MDDNNKVNKENKVNKCDDGKVVFFILSSIVIEVTSTIFFLKHNKKQLKN